MDSYTITLTREEMETLINATHVAQLKYQRPEMTEAARKAAPKYGELCSKLYYTMIEQDNE